MRHFYRKNFLVAAKGEARGCAKLFVVNKLVFFTTKDPKKDVIS